MINPAINGNQNVKKTKMGKTIIKISKKTLKSCVNKDGDLTLTLDLDVRELEDYPQGDEIFLRSHKDDNPENYNDTLCLASNQLLIYVHGESFRISRAMMRATKILYEQMKHELDYVEFAKLYSENPGLSYKDCNEVCNSACKLVNKKYMEKNIPVRLRRSESVVRLVLEEK